MASVLAADVAAAGANSGSSNIAAIERPCWTVGWNTDEDDHGLLLEQAERCRGMRGKKWHAGQLSVKHRRS